MKRVLFVASLDILALLVPQGLPISAQEVVKFGWMMLHAREMKVPYTIVGTANGVSITVITVKMHR